MVSELLCTHILDHHSLLCSSQIRCEGESVQLDLREQPSKHVHQGQMTLPIVISSFVLGRVRLISLDLAIVCAWRVAKISTEHLPQRLQSDFILLRRVKAAITVGPLK